MNMMNMEIRTAKQAIEAAGLNWKVSKRDIFYRGMDEMKGYDDAKAIVREDNESVLGIVGNRYTPIQNAEVFSFLDSFIESDEAKYKSANSYKNGRVISVDLLLTREDIHTVRVGDNIETVIRVVTSHDGSQKLHASFLMNRLVCKNGLVVPGEQFGFVTKHTENCRVVMENGRDLIQTARTFGIKFAEQARKMSGTILTANATREYVNRVLGIKKDEETATRTDNKRDEILALAYRGLGNTGRSLWDAYNGVTEYADHHISTRGDNDRLSSSVLGTGLQLKERAYTVAEEFIHA